MKKASLFLIGITVLLSSCATNSTSSALSLKPSVWKGHTSDDTKTDSVVFTIKQIDTNTGDFSGFIEDGKTMISSGLVKGKIKGAKMTYSSFMQNGSRRIEKVSGKLSGNTFKGKYKLYHSNGKAIDKAVGTVSFSLAEQDRLAVTKAESNWKKEVSREVKIFNARIAQYEKNRQAHIKKLMAQNGGRLPRIPRGSSGNSDYYRAITDAARIQANGRERAAYHKADAQRMSSYMQNIGNIGKTSLPTISQPSYGNPSRPQSYGVYNSSGTQRIGTLKPMGGITPIGGTSPNGAIMPIGGWGN